MVLNVLPEPNENETLFCSGHIYNVALCNKYVTYCMNACNHYGAADIRYHSLVSVRHPLFTQFSCWLCDDMADVVPNHTDNRCPRFHPVSAEVNKQVFFKYMIAVRDILNTAQK